MKTLNYFYSPFLSILLISLNGYSQYADTTKPATIYFIRDNSTSAFGNTLKIKVNRSTKINLKNNSYQSISYSKSTLNYSQSRISTYRSQSNPQKNNPITFLPFIGNLIMYYLPNKYILDSIEPGKNYYLKFYPYTYPKVLSEKEGIKILKTIELNKAAIAFNKNNKTNNVIIKPKTGSRAKPPIVSPDSSYIYFIRAKKFRGGAVPIKVKISESKVIYIPNNTSYVYSTADSLLELSTVNTHDYYQNSTLNLKPEKGNIYYIKVGIPPRLQLINEQQALRFLSTY